MLPLLNFCYTDCQLLQNQLCRVARWAEEWQLVFNTNKCTATSMSPTRIRFTYGSIALASTEVGNIYIPGSIGS